MKNLELETCLNRMSEDNDYMRMLLGWLSVHQPQLGMMIAEFKRADRRGLGFKRVSECSGERERNQ